jgi:alkanesulfonate monooxygenase SsuD/methylene tetrahydromethanopterin reductase-like flavin-dependent oxidoreductase (luciferase family)
MLAPVAAIEFGLAMDFGTERAPLHQVLDELTPLLELAEANGFHSVVAGQTFPTRPGFFHLPSPLMVLAALAPRTKLNLGTGVTLQPGWQLLNLAYDGAILDQLSGGRFFLGIAVANQRDWSRFGFERATVGQRFDELLQALKALWSGATSFEGQFVRTDQPILPLPLQPGGPPILVGGMSPRAARRAAAYGDGYYAATQYRLPAVVEQIGRYKAALTEAGKPAERPTIAINRLCCLAESDEQAIEQGRTYVSRVLRAYASSGALKENPDDPQLLERVLGEVALVGSPDTVRQQMQAYVNAGVSRFELRVAPGDMPLDLIARTIRLAGQKVIPHFQ